MLESVEDQARALAKLSIQPGKVRAVLGDARDLRTASLGDASVDVVVTSPPYSIALDYVKNDEHALEAMLVDVPELRNAMTGVRGRGPKQKLALYNEDMQAVFGEVHRVLKPGCAAAFVIGDATVDGQEYTTTETMTEWAAAVGLNHERTLRKVVFGLYSVMTDEKILMFRKPKEQR
jgi:tRNA G10  N-methylase Trm11